MTVIAVTLMGLLAVLIGLSLRRWDISLLGPLFRYEMLRSSRHMRVFSLRCVYAGALFLILYLVYARWFGWDGRSPLRDSRGYNSGEWGSSSINEMAEFGRSFAYACLWVQLLAAIVLTPILTAGAITEERGRRTFDFVLLTHLHDREIVVGKLAARLSHVALILATGLPLLGLVQLFGGVDPNLVLAAFVGTLAMTISIGSVAVFRSVQSYNTPQAIAATYLVCLGYVVASMCCLGLAKIVPGLGWVGDGNPFAVVAREYGDLGPSVPPHGLPESLLRFVVFHFVVVCTFCTMATRRLRRHLDQPSQRLLRTLREVQTPRAATDGTAIALQGFRRGPWPADAENLLWWKEISSEGFGGWRRRDLIAVIIALAGVTLGLCGPFLIAVDHGVHYEQSEDGNLWARGTWAALGCVFLLALALNAARTFSRERTQRTLECLLVTPLESRSILGAKMFACIVAILPGWIFLAWIWIAALLSGSLSILAVPLLAIAWIIFAVIVAEIGVWCSLASRNTLRATIFTLAILAVISLAPLAVGMTWDVLAEALGWPEAPSFVRALWSYGASPPLTLWGLAFTLEVSVDAESLIASLLGTVCYGLIAWLLWRQLNARFGRLTGRMPVI